MQSKSQVKISSWTAWILASRPKTLTASIMPIFLGTCLSVSHGNPIHWEILAFTLLSALFIQIGINLVNDTFDFKKGADTQERLGPPRATQSGWLSMQQVLGGAFICFVLGLFFGLPLINQGGWIVLGFLSLCIILGYLYTGGPYPLAYLGLGELFVFIFFGPVITGMTYYLQSLSLNSDIFLAGIQIGCLATAIISMNNLRDIEGDRRAKKMTLPVRFGKRYARWEITFMILSPFILNFLWLSNRGIATQLPWLSFPIALLINQRIWNNEPSRLYNQFFGMTALLHFLFGILLVLSLLTFRS